jgi:hypothetical protein
VSVREAVCPVSSAKLVLDGSYRKGNIEVWKIEAHVVPKQQNASFYIR